MYGVNSMTRPLQRVAVRKPGISLHNAVASEWHYGPSFNPDTVEKNHKDFIDLLTLADIEILWMDTEDNGIADAVFTYDASLMTQTGAILMSPGKQQRKGEQHLHRQFYEKSGIPVIGEVTGQGLAEAGDTLWLDDHSLLIGRGFRTNQAGINQIEHLLEPTGIKLYSFDLPVYHGEAACLHLMSLISMVNTKQALICKPLLPVGLFKLLQHKGIELIEVPYDEFESSQTLCANVLAIRPGECIMVDGFVKTQAKLEAAGIRIKVFNGTSLCVGCEGGPTCLTRPILRR